MAPYIYTKEKKEEEGVLGFGFWHLCLAVVTTSIVTISNFFFLALILIYKAWRLLLLLAGAISALST